MYMYCAEMDVQHFYRKKRARKVTTIEEAVDIVKTISNPVAIVVLPPVDGDREVDSDSEQVPEDLQNDDIFETAGEVEVEARN